MIGAVKRRLNSAAFADERAGEMVASRSFWVDAGRRFLRNRMAVFSVGMLVALILFAIFGNLFARWSFEEIDWNVLGRIKEDGGPSLQNGHWFGVDELGRDLYGARRTGHAHVAVGRLHRRSGFGGPWRDTRSAGWLLWGAL